MKAIVAKPGKSPKKSIKVKSTFPNKAIVAKPGKSPNKAITAKAYTSR